MCVYVQGGGSPASMSPNSKTILLQSKFVNIHINNHNILFLGDYNVTHHSLGNPHLWTCHLPPYWRMSLREPSSVQPVIPVAEDYSLCLHVPLWIGPPHEKLATSPDPRTCRSKPWLQRQQQGPQWRRQRRWTRIPKAYVWKRWD